MENEKIKNQEISENDVENVAGGAKFHVDTESPKVPAQVDALYLTWLEYLKLKKAGVIGKNRTIDMSRIDRAASKDLEKILSNSQFTAGKKKLWEVRVDIV